MKLIIAVMHETDGDDILKALTDADFRVTRIASGGGILRRGNATLLIGSTPERVEAALQILRANSAPPVDPGVKRATVYVLNTERHETLS